ncbi:MAG: hypothetical protein ACRDGL_11125, partial [Candidatus Limnocylindrales bacterium]
AMPIALIAAGGQTLDDVALAATGNGRWSTVGWDGVGDMSFGAGEAIGHLGQGAQLLEEATSTARSTAPLLDTAKGELAMCSKAFDGYTSLGGGVVYSAGSEGTTVIKASDEASRMEGLALNRQVAAESYQSQLDAANKTVTELAPQVGAASSAGSQFRYAMSTFSPRAGDGTYSSLHQFFSGPTSYAGSMLGPVAGSSPAGALRTVGTEWGTRLTGAAALANRVVVGVGAASTGVATWQNTVAWPDAASGR